MMIITHAPANGRKWATTERVIFSVSFRYVSQSVAMQKNVAAYANRKNTLECKDEKNQNLPATATTVNEHIEKNLHEKKKSQLPRCKQVNKYHSIFFSFFPFFFFICVCVCLSSHAEPEFTASFSMLYFISQSFSRHSRQLTNIRHNFMPFV